MMSENTRWAGSLTIRYNSGASETRRAASHTGDTQSLVDLLRSMGWRVLLVTEDGENLVAETSATYGKIMGHWSVVQY